MLKSFIPKENYYKQEGQANYYRFYNNEDVIPSWGILEALGLFTQICGKSDNQNIYKLNSHVHWTKNSNDAIAGWREIYTIMPCTVYYNLGTKDLVQINSLEDLISYILKNMPEDQIQSEEVQALLSGYQKLTKEEFLKQTSEKGYLPQ